MANNDKSHPNTKSDDHHQSIAEYTKTLATAEQHLRQAAPSQKEMLAGARHATEAQLNISVKGMHRGQET